MLKEIVDVITETYSGKVAKDDVAAIIRHHRIQASPGYRAAALYVHDELEKAGLDVVTESYPADRSTAFWTAGSFQEWSANSATLHLTQPESHAQKLADYRELKLSIIQRSTSFSGDLELITVDDGLQESDYDGLDVAGKLVLTKGNANRVRQLAVNQFGAAGILFDGMNEAPPVRLAMDLPDARQYTSFWWSGTESDKECFGFVLSPRQGAAIRKLIRQREQAGEPRVMAHVEVDAELYDGEIEVVSATIPGRERGRILLVSHLCHPEPSANDNASGVAANLEAARTLQRLVSAGKIPQPRRTIQFLWMPEMTGSYAFLSRHEDEIPEMIAGINLDMVGEDQAQTGSVFTLERPPEASASFVPDLVERLRTMIFDDVKDDSGKGSYSLMRYATMSFAGGSDHYIFSDPTVGVPMPMMNQWPDKFYHTSADTLDKVSAESLAKAGALAASAAYVMANAGEKVVTWLAHEMTAKFQMRLTNLVQTEIAAFLSMSQLKKYPGQQIRELERKVEFSLDRFEAAMSTLDRLWEYSSSTAADLIAGARKFADGELDRVRLAAAQLNIELDAEPRADEDEPPSPWEQRAAEMIPLRLYRGPCDFMRLSSSLTPEDRNTFFGLMKSRGMQLYRTAALAEYWADGIRTGLEIADLVELESGIRDPEVVVTYFQLLHKLGLVASL